MSPTQTVATIDTAHSFVASRCKTGWHRVRSKRIAKVPRTRIRGKFARHSGDGAVIRLRLRRVSAAFNHPAGPRAVIRVSVQTGLNPRIPPRETKSLPRGERCLPAEEILRVHEFAYARSTGCPFVDLLIADHRRGFQIHAVQF